MAPKRPQDTIVGTPADLYELWRDLMGDGGFAYRSVWLLFLNEDGRPEPVIVPIDELPKRPDKRFVEAMRTIAEDLVRTGEVGSVALLLSRPGPHYMTEDDRRWARALSPIGRRWPIHLATTGRIQVFAPDDLLAAREPPDAA